MFWIMGIFKKIKLANTLKSIGLGITDAIGISSVLKSNLDSEHQIDEQGRKTGKGKLNFTRLIVAIAVILSIFSYLKGWITEEDVKNVFKLIF